ncbi:ATP-binding protein [Candidatus Pacearchaeota archaeon]|nr:ATP-binding protein [Candidatus Pacearchaeota archaeon]
MDFKSIIKEQREELEKIEKEEKIIERTGLNKSKESLKYPNILAILGIRRCGKSIFSYLLAKPHKFAYINFDDERLAGLKSDDLNKILESFYELYEDIDYIILDEIQNVDNWELFVNRLRRTKKIILTGSNSKLLSGELSTHLTGRYLDIILFPFSFKEFLKLKEVKENKVYTTQEKAEIMKTLQEYLEIGGFPEAYKFGKGMISKIYEDILTKDILLRHNISKKEEIKKLAKYLITNSSGEITYSKLARIFNIKHVSTISNWISYLENAFLIFRLERFDFKLKQQFIAPKKVYCIDSGLMNSIGFKFSENKGKVIENEVALELQRRKAKENSFEVYYWKDYQQNEVDFVIKKDKKIESLIQVSYINSKEEIREREINALLKSSKDLMCKNLIVITWDYETEEKFDGENIKFVPLWKWLLE